MPLNWFFFITLHHPSLVFAVSRAMILVFSGSLWLSKTQSLARISLRDARDLKEHTARLHHRNPILGEPLPEPIRVSAGFSVIGLSGKILIQTWPPRLV